MALRACNASILNYVKQRNIQCRNIWYTTRRSRPSLQSNSVFRDAGQWRRLHYILCGVRNMCTSVRRSITREYLKLCTCLAQRTTWFCRDIIENQIHTCVTCLYHLCVSLTILHHYLMLTVATATATIHIAKSWSNTNCGVTRVNRLRG